MFASVGIRTIPTCESALMFAMSVHARSAMSSSGSPYSTMSLSAAFRTLRSRLGCSRGGGVGGDRSCSSVGASDGGGWIVCSTLVEMVVAVSTDIAAALVDVVIVVIVGTVWLCVSLSMSSWSVIVANIVVLLPISLFCCQCCVYRCQYRCSVAVSGTVWSRAPLSVCLAVVLPGCSTRDNTVYESFGCATVVLYAPSCGCVAVSCLSLSGSLGETLCSHLLCSERPLCDGRILSELRCSLL